MPSHGSDNDEVDFYRDTWARYLGYANELGEAFRPLVPKLFVWGTYGLSTAYVLADTNDKVGKADKEFAASDPRVRTAEKAEKGLDTLLWQGLASVIVPGYTIHQVVHWSSRSFKAMNFGPRAMMILPTTVGLGAIPLIVHPIDTAIHKLGDYTWRSWTQQAKTYYIERKED
mmetsp:Transcript_30175/g.73427  ORF Transcript_30175/g.73427 Transcript_30175/m.73427 type:complete len:172 (-) Transcript_30175:379-894(-)